MQRYRLFFIIFSPSSPTLAVAPSKFGTYLMLCYSSWAPYDGRKKTAWNM